MTAEVAVLNRIGVALAADSAVTIGSASDKIYTSADKLFQLTSSAPVGVMVYGNALLSGVPWETVIKAYRRHLKGTTYGTIDEYAASLFSFLTNNLDLFPLALQDRYIGGLILGFLARLRDELEKRIDQSIQTNPNGFITDDDIPSLVETLITEQFETIREANEIDHLPADHREKVLAHFRAIIQDGREQILGTLPIADETYAKLELIIVELLVRTHFGPHQGGLVIAGFGERDFAPALISYELEAILLGAVRRREANRCRIDEKSSACIIPFAQTDPVDLFLQGIDEGLDRFMRRTTHEVVNGALDLLLRKLEAIDAVVATQLRAAVQPEITEMLKALFGEWKIQKKKFSEPVVDTVANLPKDELAAMSEALVNLTKFRRRITPERETVGGPIDVAVLTKGDGFVWIRRKHYFDPALNPRILAHYKKEY